MAKAAYFTATLPASITASKVSATQGFDLSTFIPVALFSGIGLLASLISILTGVQGVWY